MSYPHIHNPHPYDGDQQPLTFEEWLEAATIRYTITKGNALTYIQLDRLKRWFAAGYSPQTAAHWLQEGE